MKKILFYTVFSQLFLIGCSIDEIETFSYNDYLYFYSDNEGGTAIDELGYMKSTYTFLYEQDMEIKEVVIKLPVRIAGTAKSKDRFIDFEIIDSISTAQEGLHYELLEPTESLMPASDTEGSINIKLLKTPDMDQKAYDLAINIVENDDFKIGTQATLMLSFSNFILKPNWWNSHLLGDFSMVKCALWYQFMEITDGSDPWSVEPYIYWEIVDDEQVAREDATARKQSVALFGLWLGEGDENGEPYLDENGRNVIETLK